MTAYLLLALLATPLLLVDESRALSMGPTRHCLCHGYEARVIPPRSLRSIEILPRGPHCKATEVIASLVQGHKVCLDPTAAWVKRLIRLVLEKQKRQAKRTLD
ncbi:interleukin-8-like [Scleropages formosus]|uniref:Interleukin-8-like n=1 Tax=Scleropages formosus TaxID=113540 RepID=A0A8C9SAJ2_SCLFO|nr:interleukin-8-like [Scleropages formosus]